ncbi:MAG: patatin-like phospholipase family protein [Acidimicrobiales bacterium]|jgi:NTE family protein
MTPAAVTTSFVVVFSLFVVAFAVLVVLTVRFVVRQARVARSQWLAGEQAGHTGDTGEDGDAEDEDEDDEEMTALVLAGGSTRGAIQIGMLQVLAEHGFVPDRIYGSSVGAINGVGFAADPTREGVEQMTRVWLRLRREDIYPQGRLHGPWLYLQQRDAVFSNSGLRAVIEEGIPFERLEDAVVPVEVVATSLANGGERWFTYGPAVDAVLASAAMPAIFPPVEIDGERYIDGGVVDNVPLQRAIDAGATRIVVLLCSPPVFEPPVSRRPVEGMVNALFISIHARFVRDMSHLPDGVEVILCAGPEGATRDFDDFSTTEHLIALGRAEASEVVRRYGLGTIAYPAPPMPARTVVSEDGDPDDERRTGDRRSGDRRVGVTDGEVPTAGQPRDPAPAGGPEPLTQPDPGT